MAELTLTINNKTLPPYEFSLEGEPSQYVLEDDVHFDDKVVAELSGDYAVGVDPYFELVAGHDPDIGFLSLDIADGKGDLYCQKTVNGKVKKKRNLFAQVYGNSQLRLRYWKDHDNCPNESSVVLSILIAGIIPDHMEKRLEALSAFFRNDTNGYFLRDPFHGHTQKEFDLIFRSGYISYRDPLIELDCINKLYNEEFTRHLRGVARRPVDVYYSTWIPQSPSRVRRMSPSSWRKIDNHGLDNVSVWEERRIPTFYTGCNNVLSTFLHKLYLRVRLIHSDLERCHGHSVSEYKTTQDDARKYNRKHSYKTSLMENDREVLNENKRICEDLLVHIQAFLNLPIFCFSEKRKATVFGVHASEFQRTEHYRYLYREMLRFELTHFYWYGDRHSMFKIPLYQMTDAKGDFWVRKYSMQYEYWCYLRIHQTLIDLGFRTMDAPDVNIMHQTTYRNEFLQITLFHDVHSNKEYRRSAIGLFPLLKISAKTPDFAMIFENLGVSGKTALLVLDAKSDASIAAHMHENRNKYLAAGLVGKGRKAPNPMLVQSWTILSGEKENSKAAIECPPHRKERQKAFDEYSELNEDEIESVELFRWDASHSRFLYQVPKPDTSEETPLGLGLGYLRTRIKCDSDEGETDHFKLFLEAQVKLMEQLLA